MCLTDKQLRRQDFVDKRIFELIGHLGPNSIKLEWDIELTGHIRDSIKDVIVRRLKLMAEMEFYPFLKE
jgi:hypothetical protein